MNDFLSQYILKERNGYEMAARLTEHALHARVSPAVTSKYHWTRFSESLYHNWYYRNFYLLYGFMMLFLITNFEEPRVFQRGEELTEGQIAGLRLADVLWLVLCSFDFALQVVYSGGLNVARKRGWLWVKFIVIVVLVSNLIAYWSYGVPYVGRVLRPLLVLERMRNVRKIVASTVETATRLTSVIVLLTLNLMVHSILGFLLFAGIQTSPPSCQVFRLNNPPTNCSTMLYPPDTCDNYFASLGESTMHMFELMTAVNFPTVAIPVMKCNKLSALFFISYIIISVYLLFNLALAVVYAEFHVAMRAEVLLRFSRIFSGLDRAFSLLVAQENGGSSAVRSAVSKVQEWGGGPPRRGAEGFFYTDAMSERGRPRVSTVGGAEFDAPGFDDVPSGCISLETFTQFWLDFRKEWSGGRSGVFFWCSSFRKHTPDESKQLARGLFSAFAYVQDGAVDGKPTMDSHAFRRCMLLFGNIQAKSNPSLADIEDAHINEEYLEIEAFYSGPLPTNSFREEPLKESVVVVNPLTENDPPPPPLPPSILGSIIEEGEEEERRTTPSHPLAVTSTSSAVGASNSGGGGVGDGSSPPKTSVKDSINADSSSPTEVRGGRRKNNNDVNEGTTSRNRAGSSSIFQIVKNSFSRGSYAATGAGGGGGGVGDSRLSIGSFSLPSFVRNSFSSAMAGPRYQSFSALMDVRRSRYLNPGLASPSAGLQSATSPASPSPLLPGVVAAAVEPTGSGSWAALQSFRARLRFILDSPWTAASFDVSTSLAGVFVLIQLTLETDEDGNPFTRTIGYLSSLVFVTLAYGMLYVSLRVFAWGPLRYWRRSGLNRFDATVLVLTLVTLLLEKDPKIDLWLGETLTFLRLVRLIRIFRFIPGYSSTILAFRDIIPLLGQQIIVLVTFLYIFAVVGMHAFGGLLARPPDPPGQVSPAADRVARSSYGLYNYYDVVNFDTLPNAMFSQIYLLSINDWVVLMEGCVAATGRIARLYFILFWPINVLFLFNLIIAFITVAFGAEKDRRDAASALAESAKDLPEGSSLERREAFLAATVFTVGVVDWRQSLLAVQENVRGWLFIRTPRFGDVYEAMYKGDVVKSFPGTLGSYKDE